MTTSNQLVHASNGIANGIWCHSCQLSFPYTLELTSSTLNCPSCNSEFIEISDQDVERFLSPEPTFPLTTTTSNLHIQTLSLHNNSNSWNSANNSLVGQSNSIGNPGVVILETLGFNPDQLIENILHHILMNDPTHNRNPPASGDAINNLPRQLIESTSDAQELHRFCGITQEEFKIGDIVVKLPCGHAYLQDCIVQWLGMHNTCPVCRLSVE